MLQSSTSRLISGGKFNLISMYFDSQIYKIIYNRKKIKQNNKYLHTTPIFNKIDFVILSKVLQKRITVNLSIGTYEIFIMSF